MTHKNRLIVGFFASSYRRSPHPTLTFMCFLLWISLSKSSKYSIFFSLLLSSSSRLLFLKQQHSYTFLARRLD